jgi:hypothetical protein
VQDIEGYANNPVAPLPELVQNGGDPYYNPRYAHLGWAGHLSNSDYWWRK